MPNDEVSLSAHINIFALYATGNRLFVVLGVAAARPAWSRPLICKGTSRSRVHAALTKSIAVFSLGPFCKEGGTKNKTRSLNGRGPFCACKHIDPQLLDLDPASASWGLCYVPSLGPRMKQRKRQSMCAVRERDARLRAATRTPTRVCPPLSGANRRFSPPPATTCFP